MAVVEMLSAGTAPVEQANKAATAAMAVMRPVVMAPGGRGGNVNALAQATSGNATIAESSFTGCVDDEDFDCSDGNVDGDCTGYCPADVDGDGTGDCAGNVTGDCTGTCLGEVDGACTGTCADPVADDDADDDDTADDDAADDDDTGGGNWNNAGHHHSADYDWSDDANEVASVSALPSTGSGPVGGNGNETIIFVGMVLLLGAAGYKVSKSVADR